MGDGTVVLWSSTGRYLAAYANGAVRADATSLESSEARFTFCSEWFGKWAIKAHHGKYVSCNPNCGVVDAIRNKVGDWERWFMSDECFNQ